MFKKIILTAAVIATTTIAHAADPILFGPYIQRVETEKATVMWITGDRKVTLSGGGGEARTRDNYRSNTMRFDKLKPDTEYTYEIEGVKGKFRTAPEGSKNFRFVVYGDTRTDEKMHKKIVEAIRRQENVSLVLNSGDLVTKGSILDNWKRFFRSAEPLMRETYYVPCLGNHEDNAREYFDFFDLPGNEEHFSFNWGGVHFVALNTEAPDVPDGTDEMAESKIWNSKIMWEYFAKQRKWLDNDLALNYGADFFVVFFHVPFYDSKLSRREPQIEIRMAFADILEKHNTELVVTGHTHNYQHHKKGMSHYVVSGGGGASLYDLGDSIGVGAEDVEIVQQEKVNNFLVIDMEGWKLNIKALRDDETVIETFSVESQAGLRLVQRRVDSIGGLPWEQDDDGDDDVELEYNIEVEK
ncbi:MAG: metallophosphoesterase [Candidatus Hydrogenedentes bacterium]|nr:metallophosphoesterase [Candidatus Hydrogenedentota bacterium]